MKSRRRPWRRRVADSVVVLLDRLTASRPWVVLHSSPDLDDSTVALLRGAPRQIEMIVLAEDPGAARSRVAALGLDVRIVSRRSVRGMLSYLRSRVVVTTHGVFGARPRPRGKQVVGLWHGEFGKLIGTFTGEAPRHFDWVPVSSTLSRTSRVAEFAIDPDRVHVVGSPRQALLRGREAVRARLGVSGPLVVYAPTYRSAVRGMPRADGDEARLAAEQPWQRADLRQLLADSGATVWVRPHPSADQASLPSGPGVELARNPDLERLGVTFYELLAAADCFVTDYSSLWVDFVLVDRPLLAFCPDLESFRADRGLALEPHEAWFPGPVLTTGDDLVAALAEALAGADPHAERRTRTRALLHADVAGEPVAATWAYVSWVLGHLPTGGAA
ncbi:CDP-glycerol glycerophosphotransferase family protein [Nocardioides acrostichi]|uniref:CDP-glycerol glycerophosphotransferase family protein n=1 Tax=Nocardioides acrostichi TaxID=2784339 RepID=A0A930Y801_9ACTN|nr:CDP-glycerol glycerophosphotransferase family protein [Nocardioides acrostichi]MBF4162531.1 CDP-glycerol glycerophosphotransferase family protein [Nocardioides acrostichi]